MSDLNLEDKDISVTSLLNSPVSNDDSDSINDNISINQTTKGSRRQGGIRNAHALTNVSLLIKLGLNAFAQAQHELTTFCKANRLTPPNTENWDSLINVTDYLSLKSESSMPFRMDSFDEAIENGLKSIKAKHHIRAPYSATSRGYICDSIRKAKENLKKHYTNEELMKIAKEYKPVPKIDDSQTKFYRDTVEELYKSFLNQGITTMSLKSINNKIKKSLTNQETYKRFRSSQQADKIDDDKSSSDEYQNNLTALSSV